MWLFPTDHPLSSCTAKSNSGVPGRWPLRQPAGAETATAGAADDNERMLVAQLLATHGAAMECYRRGMVPDQSLEGRRENLRQASELVRCSAILTDALARHRGGTGSGVSPPDLPPQ
jgi:hypothetical protein